MFERSRQNSTDFLPKINIENVFSDISEQAKWQEWREQLVLSGLALWVFILQS